MVSQKLITYVKNGLQKGYSLESLRDALLKQGWSPSEVQEAIGIAQGTRPAAAPRPSGRQAHQEMSFMEKIGSVLKSPTDFFQAVKHEQGVGNAFRYYAILSIIPTVIGAIILLTASAFLSFLFALLPIPGIESIGLFLTVFGLIFMVIFYFAGLVFTFISAGILHAFALLVGAKNGYSNTYKASMYASTPSLLLGWIPIAGIAFMIWSIYLMIKGLSVLHDISMKRALVIILIPVIIVLAIVGLIFALGMFAPTTFMPTGNFTF